MSIRKYSNSYPFKTLSGSLEYSTMEKPVIRYVKNYINGKTQFSLFMFSSETDIKKVEYFMNKVAKKLHVTQIQESLEVATMSNFLWANEFYSGGSE